MSATTCKAPLASLRRSRRSRSSILSCTRRLLQLSAQRRVRVPLATKYVNGVEMPITLTASQSPVPRLYLPRTLPRPGVGEVNTTRIQAAYPELVGVPPEYIRERLPMQGAQMLAAMANIHAQAPTNSLPKELEVVMHDIVASDCPTHMLAVHSNSSSTASLSQRRKVTLFPVHQLVLAINCTNLPTLPRSSNMTSESGTITLPVVPLCLPSAETYPILQSYLYTKHVDSLLSTLLPSVPCNLQTLARHTMAINGLWRNACALGVVDEELWDAIDFAWGTVIDATLQVSSSP